MYLKSNKWALFQQVAGTFRGILKIWKINERFQAQMVYVFILIFIKTAKAQPFRCC